MNVSVVTGDATASASDTLIVRIADTARTPSTSEATIAVSIADPQRAQAVTRGIAAALERLAVTEANGPPEHPIVRLRSRKSLARLAGSLAGAVAVVPVTERNAKHLLELVDGIRARALAVQLVWDGRSPERSRVERHVFAVLERARATPNEPPVVLATSDRPVAALKLLVAHRSKRNER